MLHMSTLTGRQTDSLVATISWCGKITNDNSTTAPWLVSHRPPHEVVFPSSFVEKKKKQVQMFNTPGFEEAERMNWDSSCTATDSCIVRQQLRKPRELGSRIGPKNPLCQTFP